MMKLRRVYETAEEEGRPVEEVALDRFGSLDAFEEAKEERRILDEREGRRADRGRDKGKGRDRDRDQDRDRDRGRGGGGGGERRMMFTDMSTPSGGTSRSSSFRRPDLDRSGPPTPGLGRPERSRLGQATGTPLAQAHTPVIPSAMTPALRGAGPAKRALSPSSTTTRTKVFTTTRPTHGSSSSPPEAARRW